MNHRPAPAGREKNSPTTPAEAYADAPGLLAEMRWVIGHLATRPTGKRLSREFWLRHAALLDRIALQETKQQHAAEADATAAKAAHRLAQYDRARGSGPFATANGPVPPDSTAWGTSYRPYVRQEYAAWQQLTRG